MKLYEVTNGWTGESYVRVYVWAPDDTAAAEMAREAFGPGKASSLCVMELFSADSPPFVTQPSDCGWNQ